MQPKPKLVDRLLNFANEGVRLIGGYAVVLSPMMIPIAPVAIITLLLFNAILVDIPDTYHLRLIVCLLIGAGLESFALACLVVSRHAEEFNLTREAGEPELDRNIGRWALTAYIVLGLTMVTIGEILPHYQWLESAQIGRYTLLGFFLLSPFGHWVFSTEAAIRRLEARRRERQEQTEATEDRELARAKEELELQKRQAALEIQQAQAETQRLLAEAAAQKASAAVIRAETRKEAGIVAKAAVAKRQLRTSLGSRRSPEFDRLLDAVHQQAGFEPFSQGQVQEWTGRGKTSVYALLGYGEEAGKIEQVSRGIYTYRNGVGSDI